MRSSISTSASPVKTMLKESEEHYFRLLADTVPVMIWVADTEGTCTYFNQRWLDFTGRNFEQELGYDWTEDIHPDDLAHFLNTYRAAFEVHQSFTVEYRLRRQDGAYRWILDTGTPHYSPGGEFAGFIDSCIDITERKQAEEQRKADQYYIEKLHQFSEVISKTMDIEAMVPKAIDTILAIFQCDRAWLIHPCDPNAAWWTMRYECARPEFPCPFQAGVTVPMDPDRAEICRILIASDDPVIYGPGRPFPGQLAYLEVLSVKSQMAIALRPKVGQLWILGLHQCSFARDWTALEQRLFRDVALRLADAIDSLLLYRDLCASEARYRLVVDNVKQVIFQTDGKGMWTFLNPAWVEMTGFAIESSLGRNFLDYIHPNDRGSSWERFQALIAQEQDECRYEIRYLTNEGSSRWIEVYAQLVLDAEERVIGTLGTLTDITERKTTEAHIQHLAYHDPLTGLPNRALFMDRLEQALAQAQRYQHQVALLFIDLDCFKAINDTLGHAVGDALLQEVSARLKGILREEDTVARLGGDEFVIILPNILVTRDAAHVARKALTALASPFAIAGQDLHPSASIGIAIYPRDGESSETLMSHADVALYQAKDRGRHAYQFFIPEINL